MFTLSTSPAEIIKVSELASKPFIQNALANPNSPHSVLSFFFGVDYNDNSSKKELRDTTTMHETMWEFWFKAYPGYDALCQPFANVIRKAGKKELHGEWMDTVDGLMAQVILCDQLSRNVFRGTKEAFAFDDHAIEMAEDLIAFVMDKSKIKREIQGECYPSYYCFMGVPLMHSESLEKHNKALQFLSFARDANPQPSRYWDQQLEFAWEHTKVIERFGRYPHRNALYDRISTPEERAWLEDRENLPKWATSQVKRN